MTRALFTQHLDMAFEDAVGEAGAARKSFEKWQGKLLPTMGSILRKPAREAVPIFALPSRTDDLAEIESVAIHIAEHFTDLVVVGMGGSSLCGEALSYLRQPGGVNLHFVDNIDPHTLAVLMGTLSWKTSAFLIISKSGNTVETLALMAALLSEAKKHSLQITKHFFVITISNDNPLHRLAREQSMRVVAHDADLGGRFSALSCVGLIPAAAVGVDIRALRNGANIVLAENLVGGATPAASAAALHMAIMDKNIRINTLMHYSDRFGGLVAWYRQCWSESLGKHGKGTLPVRSRGVTDQHGQLQLYLEGPKDKFFTALVVDSSGQGASIAMTESNDQRFAHLIGHRLGDLALAEQQATNDTLVKAGCPVRTIICPLLDETTFGALLMHFMLEVIFTAHLLGVNAFDQPAVEQGKRLALDYLSGKKS